MRLATVLFCICFIIVFQSYNLIAGEIISLEMESKKKLGLLDAVIQTIAKQPNILLDKWQVKVNEGLWRVQRGTFNTTVSASVSDVTTHTPLTRLAQASKGTSESVFRVTGYSVGINKEFRSGIELTPHITMRSTEDMATNLHTTNLATVTFGIKVPLLRERGKAANAASEMSAKILTESSRYDLNYTTSQSILTVVEQYWNTVAAMDNLEIAEKAESRARYMLEKVKILVDAGELPASEINNLSANLHGKTATRINRIQGLFEARQALGLAMGLRFDEIVAAPLPSEPLFGIDDVDLSKIPTAQELINIGIEQRADLIALRKEQESANVLMVGARKNLKPQLDFDLSVGYKGLTEDVR